MSFRSSSLLNYTRTPNSCCSAQINQKLEMKRDAEGIILNQKKRKRCSRIFSTRDLGVLDEKIYKLWIGSPFIQNLGLNFIYLSVTIIIILSFSIFKLFCVNYLHRQKGFSFPSFGDIKLISWNLFFLPFYTLFYQNFCYQFNPWTFILSSNLNYFRSMKIRLEMNSINF